MKNSIVIASLAVSLAGCATGPFAQTETPDDEFFEAIQVVEQAERPVEIVETAAVLPLPGQLKPAPDAPSLRPDRGASPMEATRRGTEQARIEPSEEGFINAVQVYPYTEGALYRLYASPGQVSDIALQPGEELISVSAGDTVRWVVGDTSSGGPQGQRSHVLVKPTQSGLTTNLMIATDRRVYHLDLESTSQSYMAALSWRYPQDELEQIRNRNDRATRQERQTVERGLTIDDLNFDYRIDGDNPEWKPLRVFDDGAKVFIQMPDNLAQTDAPPLFVLGRRNHTQLVNYRVQGNYYIVDRLFQRAEMRLGEKDQTVLRISKGRAPRFAIFGGGR